MRSKLFIQLLLISLSLTAFSASIYDEYDNGERFSTFDTLMNEVRFPTSNKLKMERFIIDLAQNEDAFPDYPQRASALYFLGHYNFELENYQTALSYLEETKQLNPGLVKKTPLDRYITDCKEQLAYRWTMLISSLVLISWIGVILGLLFLRLKRHEIKFSKATFWGFMAGVLLVFILFSIRSAQWSDGLEEFYAPPTLVKSTLLSPGSSTLWQLAFCSFFSCAFVALSSVVVKKRSFIFSLLTAAIIGTTTTVLYYQLVIYDVAVRSGINLPKRVTFKETIIEWHKDIPEEMLPMYDKKLQLIIKDAKAEAAKEDLNR